MTNSQLSETSRKATGLTRDEKYVIFASSAGTTLEYYDFYLYATLAPFFASLFFPPGNETAALLSAFATYAVGFLIRPFGALVFGRLGDIVGRKYTFLATVIIMGGATFLVGLLPTFETAGWFAPVFLILLRMAQGLALGGEWGGAVIYVAEHTRANNRGYATSFIQTNASLGFFLSVVVIGLCRVIMDAPTFADWGWRLPFVFSVLLLGLSVWVRLRLSETPVFNRMKAEGKVSKHPFRDSFFKYPNNRFVILALFGLTAGQGVVWYTGQFYAMFFLIGPLKLDYIYAYWLVGIAVLVACPFFIFFGWLSDRIGRVRLMMASCIIGALTYFPLFGALTYYVNPDLAAFQNRNTPIVHVDKATCQFHLFVTPLTTYSECDRAKDFMTKRGLSFETKDVKGAAPALQIGDRTVEGWDSTKWGAALNAAGAPQKADPAKVNWVMAELILIIMVIYVTMNYAPIAAYLVELFPANIRYTSLSLPYQIGGGWFGGMLPLTATAMTIASGDIYYGLWYPVGVALMTFLIGSLFLRETRGTDLFETGRK